MSKVSAVEFTDIIQAELPMAAESGIYLQTMEYGTADIILPYNDNSLRPGGTIAGPQMMMLADVCMYAVVLSMIGEVKLAVTTNFNINFLRKPRACDLIARGKIIKLGKRLAIIEVSIYSDEDIVAHATGTYSIPPIEQT
ncbi:MAG: PaaI family thioesterase [Gammaproteobacteria bacterium]|nr:MAG: PaaI family thioesterase [Gammaproteobacteria bacterium]